jgi:uncharacterized membrane protein
MTHAPLVRSENAAPGLIRLVPLDRPWRWLAAGWADLAARPAIALCYGALIVAASWALAFSLHLLDWIHLLLPMAAGFMFVAPILAVGLYDTSRRLEAGEPASLATAIGAWRRNADQLALLGLVLMLFHLAWLRLAQLLFALFFSGASPGWDGVVPALLFSRPSLPFLATGTAIGFVLAAILFAIAAVSIPMLHDRPVSAITAVATSVAAVRRNWKPMAVWAALIVVFTAFGIATLFVGLIVTMPLIGHATWHAYRDLVADVTPPSATPAAAGSPR